jgi:hypothetical protein
MTTQHNLVIAKKPSVARATDAVLGAELLNLPASFTNRFTTANPIGFLSNVGLKAPTVEVVEKRLGATQVFLHMIILHIFAK